jgi:cytochrome P450
MGGSGGDRPTKEGEHPSDPTADFFDAPYPVLDEARRTGALVPDESTGALLATRYHDVRAIIKNRALSKDPRKLSAHGRTGQPMMLFLDPPEHTRLRALVQKAFTPQRVQMLAPRVEAITEELLAATDGHPVFDLLEVLARPLPVRVIGELLGIDASAVPAFADWCEAMSYEFNPSASPEVVRRASEAKSAFNEFIRASMTVRRREPRDDLVTALLEAEQAGDRLSESELISLCRLLLLAGNITTTDMIGNGVLALLDHPDELERLRADMGLLPRAVDEMLRYDTSVTGVGRNVVGEPAVVAGQSLPVGTRLHACLAGANRNPQVFADPHRFDITREENLHLSFGAGIHVCLGASLARLEMEVAIRALVERFPRLRLAVPREQLEWQRIVYFRGLKRLPLAVTDTNQGGPAK